MLAHHMPEFRDYLLAPTGVPLLIQNIKGLATANPPIPMLDLCAGLGNISHHPWCLSSVPLDTCQVVNNLLMCVLITSLLVGPCLTQVQHQPEQQPTG
jgi:hypothetical protein